jgi:hypothetical protein
MGAYEPAPARGKGSRIGNSVVHAGYEASVSLPAAPEGPGKNFSGGPQNGASGAPQDRNSFDTGIAPGMPSPAATPGQWAAAFPPAPAKATSKPRARDSSLSREPRDSGRNRAPRDS